MADSGIRSALDYTPVGAWILVRQSVGPGKESLDVGYEAEVLKVGSDVPYRTLQSKLIPRSQVVSSGDRIVAILGVVVGYESPEVAVALVNYDNLIAIVNRTKRAPARVLPERKEWDPEPNDGSGSMEPQSSDYVDGWNDALDAVEGSR